MLNAQTTAADFRVDVKLVNVVFSVRNPASDLVTSLARDDVELYEDGVRQQLRYFAADRETPLTLGILIDRSGSQGALIGNNATLALDFLKQLLRPQDRAFLVSFDDTLQVLAGPDATAEQRASALGNFRNVIWKDSRLGPDIRRNGYSAVLDAVYWSTSQFLAAAEGRKALVMIGDGEEQGSTTCIQEVMRTLQNSDVVFYGLNNGGAYGKGGRHSANRMPALCKASGGRQFKTRRIPPARAFAAIKMELRALYSTGYVSTNPARDGRFRRIELKLKDPNLRARARPGYYAR